MITFLRGTVKDNTSSLITLEIHGVGFGIHVLSRHNYPLNSCIELLTHLHWSSENGPQLFGFNTAVEKDLFTLVLSSSALGPKGALTLLSHLSPAALVAAVSSSDTKALSAVPGIGPKRAATLILHLKDKIQKLAIDIPHHESPIMQHHKKISDVLTSLNYTRNEIQETLDYLHKSPDEQQSFDGLLRIALAFLSKTAVRQNSI